MNSYTVKVEEQYEAYVCVEANSQIEAFRKVEEMRQHGDLDSKFECMKCAMSIAGE